MRRKRLELRFQTWTDKMIIKNAEIYCSDHCFHPGDLMIQDDRIVRNTAEEALKDAGNYISLHEENPRSLLLSGEEVLDASGLLALPGLVDIHFHGAAGHDLCDGNSEGLAAIARYEAEHGITAICPATMTLPEEKLNTAMDNAAAFRYSAEVRRKTDTSSGPSHQPPLDGKAAGPAPIADLVGINLEGPFISPKKPGAQDPGYIIPADSAMFRRLQARCGDIIRIVCVAPEEPGNLEFIQETGDTVRISLAHTAADYDCAREAFSAGAKQMTHLYNAMPGISHRAPGPVIAALESGADVELIADGVHIHPAVVRFTFNIFGPEHVILISDSMEATGLPDGEYRLGGQNVTVSGNLAVLTDHPDTIAGSVTNLYDCMKNAVLEMGVPLEVAVRAASENPAHAIGIGRDYGSLVPGHLARILLTAPDLRLVSVIIGGRSFRRK